METIKIMKPVETFILNFSKATERGIYPDDTDISAYVACMSYNGSIIKYCWFGDYYAAANWALVHSAYKYTP